MAERRLRCVLVRTCDTRTANTTVSICLYILLTDIYEMIFSLVICIGNSMVSSAIQKKHAQVSFSKTSKQHESEGRVLFEVFEKLTSECFFKLHEKPCYYLLIMYMKKLCRIQSYACVTLKIIYSLLIVNILRTKKHFVRTTEVKQCVLITKIVKISKIALYFLFWHCISLNGQ